jgi:uncharacterized protein (TIGR01244 family)
MLAALLASAAVLAEDCAGSGAVGASVERATPLPPIKNARVPLADVLSGGQPTREQIEDAARAGVRTVINLRTDGEPGFEWERAAVEGHGMRYIHIPIAGASGLTRRNVESIDAALVSSLEQGPVLLHCASGNRIGAVLALREAWLLNTDAEAALQYGVRNGLSGLEPETRKLLGLSGSAAKRAEPR